MSRSASVYGCVLVTLKAATGVLAYNRRVIHLVLVNVERRLQRTKLLEDQQSETRIHGWMTLTKILVPFAFTV